MHWMSGLGTWKHNNTHDDVIEVFISKSVYFRNHSKVFPLLVHYPAMKEWFEKTADTVEADRATADAVVWGSEKHSFDSLRKILTAHQNEGRYTEPHVARESPRSPQSSQGVLKEPLWSSPIIAPVLPDSKESLRSLQGLYWESTRSPEGLLIQSS
jgi:hypothetical protein